MAEFGGGTGAIGTRFGMYRIVQEALNNVVRHAHAQTALVQLVYMAGEVRLTIMDDGVGFDTTQHATGHFGLNTMQERAALIGATCTLTSQPQHGTTVRIIWKVA